MVRKFNAAERKIRRLDGVSLVKTGSNKKRLFHKETAVMIFKDNRLDAM